MDKYRLRYATIQDATQLGPLAASVMHDDFHKWLEPVSEFPVEAQIRLRIRDFTRRIRVADLDNLHLVAVKPDNVRSIVGYCHFSVKNVQKQISEIKAWVDWAYSRYDKLLDKIIYRRDLAYRNMTRARAVGASLGSPSKRYLTDAGGKPRPYVYVHITCVAADHQGSGIGSALVKSVIRFAVERQLDIFLEATPEGAQLYRKHGFEELCVCDIIDNGKIACQVPLMLWRYKAHSSDQASSPSISPLS